MQSRSVVPRRLNLNLNQGNKQLEIISMKWNMFYFILKLSKLSLIINTYILFTGKRLFPGIFTTNTPVNILTCVKSLSDTTRLLHCWKDETLHCLQVSQCMWCWCPGDSPEAALAKMSQVCSVSNYLLTMVIAIECVADGATHMSTISCQHSHQCGLQVLHDLPWPDDDGGSDEKNVIFFNSPKSSFEYSNLL